MTFSRNGFRTYIKEETMWTIYILRLDSPSGNKKFYGIKTIYYTGITSRDLGIRLGDYILRRGSGYINKVWRDARRTPVYAEYFFGNEYNAKLREKKIQSSSKRQKEMLIESSSNNMLVAYKPLKHVVLRGYKDVSEQYISYIR